MQNLLFDAVKSNKVNIAKRLIKKGAAVDVRNEVGNTLLVYCHDSTMVKLLLDSGADVNAVCGDGMTALNKAICRAHLDMARFLINKGANKWSDCYAGNGAFCRLFWGARRLTGTCKSLAWFTVLITRRPSESHCGFA